MAGLVLELQRDALDMKVPVADLLRKALVVSRKLDLAEVQSWIEQELGGYGDTETPDYRKVFGQPKAFNPYRGWQPIMSEDPKYMDALSERYLAQSVAELEDLSQRDSGALTMPYGAKASASIRKAIGIDLEVVLFVSRQDLVKVLDAVRNKVLDWSLDLEKRGIIGADMTFSKEEKITASQIHYNTVTNIGTMNNSQLQQNSSGSQVIVGTDIATQVTAIVDAVFSNMADLKLSPVAKDELVAELETLRAQAASPKPKTSILKEGLQSVKAILEGAAGNVVASGLLSSLAPVIAVVT